MAESPTEVVQRWEDAGGHWRVIGRHPDTGAVTVGLYRCDGGEEMGRVQSADPALLAFLAGRRRSDD
ncbi:hypothetical protein [Mycolicibacterium mengxianglii]|uniref:hypothetical protein n=1 Tax=Mycolicibacterium mengxianglii TaxID=2736649 RepID=UPI0018EF341A|nr:hypothetical protein [Mycolicibacterium mengxianglii]